MKKNVLEYKIVIDYPSDLQRKLNQWRHKYILHFESTSVLMPHEKTPLIMVILCRESI